MREPLRKVYDQYVMEMMSLGMTALKESSFYRYIPKDVKAMRCIPFMECLCVHCLNVSLLLEAANAAGLKGIPRRATLALLHTLCPVSISRNTFSVLVRSYVSGLARKSGENLDVESIVRDAAIQIPPDQQEFMLTGVNSFSDVPTDVVVLGSRKECIVRECDDCGVYGLLEHVLNENPEFDFEKKAFFHQWKSFSERNEDGKRITHPFNKYRHEETVETLIAELMEKLKRHSLHLFSFKNQAAAYDMQKDTLVPGQVMMVVDFAENFSHHLQRRPQSAYFGERQTTLFPVVAFFNCLHCSQLVRQEVFTISDDKKHDHFAVWTFVEEALKIIQESTDINELIVFSDNASHFKSRHHFLQLTMASVPVTWHYQGECHGKGESDASAGFHKGEFKRALKANTTIAHAVDLYDFCQQVLAIPPKPDQCCHNVRTYSYVPQVPRPPFPNPRALVGTKQIHCVCAVEYGVIDTKKHSSRYCLHCTYCTVCNRVKRSVLNANLQLCSPPQIAKCI